MDRSDRVSGWSGLLRPRNDVDCLRRRDLSETLVRVMVTWPNKRWLLWVSAITFLGAACGADVSTVATVDTLDGGVRPEVDVADAFDPECFVAADCLPSAGPCLESECHAGRCRQAHRPDYMPCDDGDPCRQGTYCTGGVCGEGTTPSCDDDNPCTEDTCSSVTGCLNEPANGANTCDDGDPCTVDDTCQAGSCLGTLDARCACDDDASCQWLRESNKCVGAYECVEGLCAQVKDSEVVCPTAGPCVVGKCAPSTGECVWTSRTDGTPCDDMNPCTAEGACDRGECVGTSGVCMCVTNADCEAFQNAKYNLCLGPLVCTAGVCLPDAEEAIQCGGNATDGPCTLTLCEPSTGLCGQVALTDGTACDDPTACGADGACVSGECAPDDAPCDDGNPCTADLCEASGACTHTPMAGICDDGDECTVQDNCDAGVCGIEALACCMPNLRN